MPQVFNVNERYKIEKVGNEEKIARSGGNDYKNLQNFLDSYVKKHNVKPEQGITLNKQELFRELKIKKGSYDRYQACRNLASQIESKLKGYIVAFFQKDYQHFWDFILLKKHWEELQREEKQEKTKQIK